MTLGNPYISIGPNPGASAGLALLGKGEETDMLKAHASGQEAWAFSFMAFPSGQIDAVVRWQDKCLVVGEQCHLCRLLLLLCGLVAEH